MGDRTYYLPFEEYCEALTRFDIKSIELTGGEPCLWPHVESALKEGKHRGLLTMLVTNGHYPEVIERALAWLDRVIVSSTQCPPKQVELFRAICGSKLSLNSHKHVTIPDFMIEDTLPATCCMTTSRIDGKEMNAIMYYNKNFYYCCNAMDRAIALGIDSETLRHPNIDFFDKKFDLDICAACGCNNKVYKKVSE